MMTLLAVKCAATIMLGFGAAGLDDEAKNALSAAKERCPQLYSGSPCVKLFQKTGEQQYRVICGPEEK